MQAGTCLPRNPVKPDAHQKPEWDRVSVEIHFRNGNGNKLRVWKGRFVSFEPEHLEKAILESYDDATFRKSQVVA